MSIEPTVVEPEQQSEQPVPEQPVPMPEPSPPGLCPECGIFFSPGQGLTRHRSVTHGIAASGTPCPVCGKMMGEGSMTRHLRNVHGKYSTPPYDRHVGEKRKRGRPKGSKNKIKPDYQQEYDRRQNVVQQERREVAVYKNLPPLTAEQVVRAAAETLWPKGIPTEKLSALMRWSIQTNEFLTEVNNQ